MLVYGTWETPHWHSWEIYKENPVENEHKMLIGRQYTMRCSGCGEMKAFRDFEEYK